MVMAIDKIEKNIKKITLTKLDKETFIFDFLTAFGVSKTTIKRLKDGNSNISTEKSKITWKKWLTFKEIQNADLYLEITKLKSEIKHGERFIIVTDYKNLLAIDTKTNDKLDIKIELLEKYFDFFLPFIGIEKIQYLNENPADVKAAEKMAKLFDEIKRDNTNVGNEFNHSLNIFFTRLLFCYFAEDTGIFKKGQFIQALSGTTNLNGSDLGEFLNRLFETLDTNNVDRKNLANYLNDFPYVNGGLFTEKIIMPKFTTHSRKVIIEAGELDWAAINPDIFGSMFQGVILPEKRSNLGMHYTSVPNIMKVINPLFLDELKEEMEKASKEKTNDRLDKLLSRIRAIKIFDPACGSGNFLIIAYKELRRLEMEIYNKIENNQMRLANQSTGIQLKNFYGIEIDDFACEIGKLALWIAEHQMHIESEKKIGYKQPTLPLQETGKIVCGNATRLDWNEVCPSSREEEVYILGNPPYLGARNQEKNHKDDMKFLLKDIKNYKLLDYISCWFYKGAEYIKSNNRKLAFVSTNSIVQGEQVGILWNEIFEKKIEINFAYTSFKWQNNAKLNAGVSVVIIGLDNENPSKKYLFSEGFSKIIKEINGYLIPSSKIAIKRRNLPIAKFPKMSYGNYTGGCNDLFLTKEEKENLLEKYPEAEILIRKLTGSSEFINGKERYCLWIMDKDLNNALKIPEILERIKKVENLRLTSKDEALNKLAQRPHQFRDLKEAINSSIIVPIVSSERRKYIPLGFLDKEYIIPNSAQAIYDAEPWILSIISSLIHNIWVKSVGGSLETRIRYSSVLCYNTFPFPDITEEQKEELEECAFKILDIRERYPGKTLAQLYDPDKMPEDLREAHRENDLAVEKCYRVKRFESDEERLEYLFKLYEKMIAQKN